MPRELLTGVVSFLFLILIVIAIDLATEYHRNQANRDGWFIVVEGPEYRYSRVIHGRSLWKARQVPEDFASKGLRVKHRDRTFSTGSSPPLCKIVIYEVRG